MLCYHQSFSHPVYHTASNSRMCRLPLCHFLSYHKLLKGKITLQSLHRHTKYACALVHPFPFGTRFCSVSKSAKMRDLWMKGKMKNLLPFPRMSEIQCMFIWDEGKGFSQMKAKCFGAVPIPWLEIKLSLLLFLFRHTSGYTWKNRECKRSHYKPFT